MMMMIVVFRTCCDNNIDLAMYTFQPLAPQKEYNSNREGHESAEKQQEILMIKLYP